MNNVREAAERLRRTDIGDHLYKHAHDQALLSAEYLKLTDGSEITPAALEALGFKITWGAYRLLVVGDTELSAREHAGRMWISIADVQGEGEITSLPSITTIGQLRALIFALTPKGPADE